MTANARISPDTFYVDGGALPASYWITLDTRQYKALWGDQGATWSPTSGIQIGGAGLWSLGRNGLGSSGVTFSAAPGAYTPSTSGLRFVHGGNDEFTFSTSGTQAVDVSVGQSGVDRSFGSNSGTTANVPRMFYESVKDGRKDYLANSAYSGGGRFLMPISVHNGAALSLVTLNFLVGQSHSSVPVSLPQMRVVKVDAQGNVTPLATNASLSGWRGAGFVMFTPTPGSGAAWYDSGNPQSIAYSCDAGIVVDTTKYRYFAQVIDESGSGALSGNEFISAVTSHTSIQDYRPQ